MKKKELKNLNLNKKSISNLSAKQVKGSGVSEAFQVCYYPVKWAFDIASYVLGCDDDDTFDSCACANTQDDESCQCTVA